MWHLEILILLHSASPAHLPMDTYFLQVSCKLLSLHTVCYHCCSWCKITNCFPLSSLLSKEKLLQEIVVPLTQVKLSINELMEDKSTPPIRPPEGIIWRSIPIKHCYIQDKLRGDIGLSFLKVNGVSYFIHLPRVMSLDIIAKCWLSRIYDIL